jgi:V/A-type H+/Na+-transporting ATPase subunit E
MSKAAADTLEKVSAEFEAEAVSDLESGRAEALARIESARRETAEAVAKILETGVKQAESVKRQVIGAAELEARNSQLRSLERSVNDAFDGAFKEVTRVEEDAYEKAITGLIEEAVRVIGPKASVYCSSKDRRAVSSAIRKLAKGEAKLTLEEKPIETAGGVILATADGSVRFDNTFEARLERMKPLLRKEVATILTSSA